MTRPDTASGRTLHARIRMSTSLLVVATIGLALLGPFAGHASAHPVEQVSRAKAFGTTVSADTEGGDVAPDSDGHRPPRHLGFAPAHDEAPLQNGEDATSPGDALAASAWRDPGPEPVSDRVIVGSAQSYGQYSSRASRTRGQPATT